MNHEIVKSSSKADTSTSSGYIDNVDRGDATLKDKRRIYKENVEKLGLKFNELPVILNGELFEIVSLKNLNVKAKCQLCVNPHSHGCSISATSNLLKHLKVCMKESYYLSL